MKLEHQRSSGLLQQLPIPEWKWGMIAMDIISELPCTSNDYNAIWMIVDRLTSIVLHKTLGYSVMILMVNGTYTCHWSSLHLTTIIIQVLKWLFMKHCLEGNADHLCDGSWWETVDRSRVGEVTYKLVLSPFIQLSTCRCWKSIYLGSFTCTPASSSELSEDLTYEEYSICDSRSTS